MAGKIVGIPWHEFLEQQFERNPEQRAEWERTALARAVAIAVIKYRNEHKLSQRALAKKLGRTPGEIGRLELGEHNPTLETLGWLSEALGKQFIVTVRPPEKKALPLSKRATILEDLVLSGGGQVVIATA